VDIEDEYLYLCIADVPIMDTYIQSSYLISLVLIGTITVCRIMRNYLCCLNMTFYMPEMYLITAP